jgi:signal transduction histidine kinase
MKKSQEENVSLKERTLELSKIIIRKDFELLKVKRRLGQRVIESEEARKIAEAERGKTLAVFNNFSDGLLVLTNISTFSLINPQAEYYLDLDAGQDLVGKSLKDPVFSAPHFDFLRELIEKGQETLRKEVEMRTNLILEVSVIPVTANKESIGTLVILHDITREKIVENLKSEFVAIAAHQLRTPLSTIKWTLSMLSEDDTGGLTDKHKDFIHMGIESSNRMVRLIDELLDITRIEEGRYVYDKVPINLYNLVESVIKARQTLITGRGIKVVLKKPRGNLPRVRVDEEKIKLAIENIFDNAIRYTFPQGRVTIALAIEQDELKISVEDTGVGIPLHQQKRVFTKFFRGENVQAMQTEGTGLGLFIAKNIIEAHNGKIWFTSTENVGTTITFTIPLA